MEYNELLNFGNIQQYVVIDKYQTAFTFVSLRDISKMLNINHSTIGKKLKDNIFCMVKSKQSQNIYYITKINNISAI